MTILVTGATGNIGRRIVDHLIDLGANDIRALTKNPAKAKLPDGVTPVTGYLGDPESLPAALDGVERMYLAPLPATLEATLDLVKKAGVDYVVALSGAAHWQEHADTIAASGLVNTQLGPGEFLENFTIWSEQIKATRTVREPYPSRGRGADLDGRHRPGGRDAAGQARIGRTTGRCIRITGPAVADPCRDRRADRCGHRRRRHVRAVRPGRDGSGIATDHGRRSAVGISTGWQAAVDQPQQANQLVAELTGTPADVGGAVGGRQRGAVPLIRR